MKRGRLLVGAALVAVGLVGLGALAEARALARLGDLGLRWERVQRGATWRVEGLQRDGLRAEALEVDLAAPGVARLRGVTVDLAALRPGGGGRASPDTPASRLPDGFTITVDGLSLRYGERVLAEGLSGAITGGGLLLEGEGVRITAPGPEGEAALAALQRPSPVDALPGTLDLRLSWPPRLTLRSVDLSLKHPLLSRRRLPLPEVTLALEGDDLTEAGGALRVGEARADVTLRCPDGLAEGCVAEVTVPEQPLADLLAPLAPLSPELRRAKVGGQGAATARYSWPEGGWTLEPTLTGLTVEGAVQGLDRLRGGPFEVQVTDAEGDRVLRTTGEGTPGWTPLRRVSPWLVAAIIAAEDSRFRAHAGYDPEAIRDALVANREAGGVVRGGSTLTQQLAKNLFLDGERSLERKLRELLLAVELDRALGKERVMELYLNVVEWGPDLWGVADAADRYFLKRPENLQPHEAAFLAAVLPAPKDFYRRWYLRGRAGEVRIDWILHNMADGGVMTHAEADRWSRTPLRFVPPPR